MQQTRLESIIETCFNTLIGFFVSYFAWPVAAWYYEIPYNHSQHFGVVLFFTVLSIARGYVIRRWFNAQLHRVAMAIAAKLITKLRAE